MLASRSMRATRVSISAALVLSLAAGLTLTGCSTLISRLLEGSLTGDGQSGPPGNLLLPDQHIGCSTPNPTATPDPNVALTESIAMPSDEFWAYIDLLGGTNDPEGYDLVSAELAKTDLDTILAFEARLTLSLYALDSDCRAQWYLENEPMQFGFVSDDVFLYARGDTASAGRATWEEAVAENTLPWGGSDPTTGYGEYVLGVGYRAAELIGVPFDDFLDLKWETIPLSFETGSNSSGWGG
jgi:hypothetical protein